MESDVLSKRLIAAVGTLVALLMALGAVVGVAVSGGSGTRVVVAAGASNAPLDLSTVPADLAEHYRYAAAHVEDFKQIPCWCGCMQYLGHRHLADCFIRADGKGWEAHAKECAICIAEATMAERMLGQGQSAHDVAEAVTLQFGQSSITTPVAH